MSQVPAKTRQQVKERDKGMCQRCPGGHPAQELQHRRARGMGSADREHIHCPCNLIFLCSTCHAIVESHRHQARLDGFAVSTHVDAPYKAPVRLREGWALLTCDGRKVPL